jgi:hypothetical protein
MGAALPLLLAIAFQPVLACLYAKGNALTAATSSDRHPALGLEQYAEKIHARVEMCHPDTQ